MAPPKDNLTESEKAFFQKILDSDTTAALQSLSNGEIRINCSDEHGNTPLMQAAFKGNMELCKTLIGRGADINWKEHEYYYTPLMFAALSGNADLCQYLLDQGADSDMLNSMGKSACDMAGFCGQTQCVYVINNFLPKSDVSKVVKNKDGGNNSAALLEVLTQLARTSNVHPVKILMEVKPFLIVKDEQKSLECALDDLMDMQMKSNETNEVMALKLHIIHFTTKKAADFIQKNKEERDEETSLQVLTRRLLRDETHLNDFLKEAIKTFPFKQSGLYATILTSFSKDSERSALNVLVQTLMGPRAVMSGQFCDTCHDSCAMKLCSKCKQARYCNVDCQKMHWFVHSKVCRAPGKREKGEDIATCPFSSIQM